MEYGAVVTDSVWGSSGGVGAALLDVTVRVEVEGTGLQVFYLVPSGTSSRATRMQPGSEARSEHG